MRCTINQPQVPTTFSDDIPPTAQDLQQLEQSFPSVWRDTDISTNLWWLWRALRHDPSGDTEDKWDLVLADALARAKLRYLERYDWPRPEAIVSPATGSSSYYFAQSAAWRRAETALNASIESLASLVTRAAQRSWQRPPS